MEEPYSFKAILNKRNNQLNFSIKKRDLPKKIADIIKKQPSALKKIVIDRKNLNFVFDSIHSGVDKLDGRY